MGRSGGVVLRSLRGQTFRFDPGATCLEFAVTGGQGYRAAYETLQSPADLDHWFRARLGLVAERVTRQDLAEAKRLREAIWHCAEARALGRPLPRSHVEALNQAAALPPPAPRIDRANRRGWTRPVTAEQLRSALARDAIDLLTGPLADRIRRCAGVNCTLVFADTSRPGQRRWCSMRRCGNRAKAREFRQRKEHAHE
jgi:predicted RNA-binding Zn ribbon-like protein